MSQRHDSSTISRFWLKTEPGANGCVNWVGCTLKNGYGQFAIDRRRRIGAHRFSWMLAFGEISDGLCVCHKCDNRRCVNPAHLFLGSHQENADDRGRKGRTARLRLTESDIVAMRAAYDGMKGSIKRIAVEYGVSADYANDVIRGHYGAHLPGAIPVPEHRKRSHR